MKILIIILLSLALTGTARGSSIADELCPNIAELASNVMSARHRGVTMDRLYAATIENMNDQAAIDMTRLIIQDAFSTPRYSTERAREQSITEFRSKWFRLCIQHAS